MTTKRIRIPVVLDELGELWCQATTECNDNINAEDTLSFAEHNSHAKGVKYVAIIEADIPIPEPVVVREVTVTTVEANGD